MSAAPKIRVLKSTGSLDLDADLHDILDDAEPERWDAQLFGSPGRALHLVGDVAPALEVGPELTPPQQPAHGRADSSPGAPSSDPAEFAGERVELAVKVVRVIVVGGPEEGTGRGRLRSMSESGNLLVETNLPLSFRTDVKVDLTLACGRNLSFAGRIVKRPVDGGMAIKLRNDHVRRRFLKRYIEQALDERSGTLATVVVTRLAPGMPPPDGGEGTEPLRVAWRALESRFDDDAGHQRFIEQGMATGQMEYVLARYRDLKGERPDDPEVAERINQIGTILGFMALRGREGGESEAKSIPAPFKLLFVMVLAVCGLYAGLTWIG